MNGKAIVSSKSKVLQPDHNADTVTASLFLLQRTVKFNNLVL
jgi:hypothetical protein